MLNCATLCGNGLLVGVERNEGCKASGAAVPLVLPADKEMVETLHYHHGHGGRSNKRIAYDDPMSLGVWVV